MTAYPSLEHIPLDQLIAAAGDPWAVDGTLQSGDAGQISELATAFRDAAACTTETWEEFARARSRFEASWNRETGEHPINDGLEVQRATNNLFVQTEQLPAIAIDLQNIAADLAEAQRMSGLKIDKLNGQLHYLDMLAGDAIARDEDTSAIAQRAVDDTSTAFKGIDGYRDAYADKLQAALTDLRLKHGYDPAAIEDVDGDAEPGQQQRAKTGTEYYDHNQRAADEALVNGEGPMTDEKADAAARLQDFATTNDPNASPEARRLAGERLDDFRMANFVGPLPRDPVLGGDARSQARSRIEMQRNLEKGYLGMPPMSRDQATQALDDGDQFARSTAVKQAYFALTSAGMSEAGAKDTIKGMLTGNSYLSTVLGATTKQVTDGQHALPIGLSPKDAHVLERFASRATKVGDLISLGIAGYQFSQDGKYEDLAGSAGSVFGGSGAAWATVMVAGSFTGPWTTAGLGLLALYLGGEGGEFVGKNIGKQFDH